MPAKRFIPSVTRRRARATATVVALIGLGAGLVAPASPASASVGSAIYTIGAPTDAVGDVVASPSPVVEGTTTKFDVRFLASALLLGSDGATVTVAPSVPFGQAPTSVALIDDTNNSCFQGTLNGGAEAETGFTVDLVSSCSVSTGDTVEIDFTVLIPSTTGSFDFTVTTSANLTPASSNSVAVSTSPPTFSATSVALGANPIYTVTDSSWTEATLSQDFTALSLTAKATAGSTLNWYAGSAGYSVTYAPPSGSPTADVVASATVTTVVNAGDTVTLTLANAVPAGDDVDVTGKGTNPAVTSSDVVELTPEAEAAGSLSTVGTTETSGNAVLFGTSPTGVTLAVSPPVAAVTATYTVSFQAQTTLEGGPGSDICIGEPAGPTLFSAEVGELVADTTAGWSFAANGTTFPNGAPPTNPGCDAADNGAVIRIPTGYDIRSGDSVTLTLVSVTNPSAGTVTDFSVATSSDTVPSYASPYVIGVSGSPGVVVTVNPPTTGALATYTISDLVASATMAGGSSAITIEAPAGTVFPNSGGSYTVEDSTTPSGSGAVTAPVAGGGTNDVAITVPAAIYSGDHLSLTIEDVINPSSASGTYTLTLLGNVTGSSAVAPFPQANVSYPNGAIVDFGGTNYVFAGGRAFGIPDPAALTALARVDDATVQTAPAGAAPSSAPPRSGTLLLTRPITESPTIYVVGTDGALHGFATPEQLLGDGYDAALVVTVTTLTGITVGATAGVEGAAGNALSTSADGAIVTSSGAYYVFAGGRAFGIPSEAALGRVRQTDKAKVLVGTVTSAQQQATIASGVLLSASGPVYVTYRGDLWPFKSPSQLTADGYGGTAAVPVPGPSGLGVVKVYTGS